MRPLWPTGSASGGAEVRLDRARQTRHEPNPMQSESGYAEASQGTGGGAPAARLRSSPPGVTCGRVQVDATRVVSGAFRLLVLILASYSLLYFSYKHYVPWAGGSDFSAYYEMYRRPLDFGAAGAPFVFRQLSALLTYAVYAAGIYYPCEIAFQSPSYDQRLFFAALCSNYVCLVAAAWLSGGAVEILTRRRSFVYPTIAGLFCLLSFSSQVYVLTGLTEGLSFLLMALGFTAYLSRRGVLLGAVLLLAVLQREAVIVAFGIIAAGALVTDRRERSFNGRLLVWAVVCFTLYVAMRTFSGVRGAEEQLAPRGLLATLQSVRVSRELVMQGLLSQGTFALWLLMTLMSRRCEQAHRSWLLWLGVTWLTLFVLGLAAGIGNNVGRICSLLTPLLAALSSVACSRVEEVVGSTDPGRSAGPEQLGGEGCAHRATSRRSSRCSSFPQGRPGGGGAARVPILMVVGDQTIGEPHCIVTTNLD